MITNLRSFNNGIAGFGKRIRRASAAGMAANAYGLLVALNRTTPVLTGKLRNNWQVSTVPNARVLNAGNSMLPRNRRILRGYVRRTSHIHDIEVFNNAPYAASVNRRRRFFQKALRAARPIRITQ